MRESVAMNESLITQIPTADNLSDLMTKPTFGAKRRRLVGGLLFDIYDDRSAQLVCLFVCKISQLLHMIDLMLADWTDLEGTERIWAGD